MKQQNFVVLDEIKKHLGELVTVGSISHKKKTMLRGKLVSADNNKVVLDSGESIPFFALDKAIQFIMLYKPKTLTNRILYYNELISNQFDCVTFDEMLTLKTKTFGKGRWSNKLESLEERKKKFIDQNFQGGDVLERGLRVIKPGEKMAVEWKSLVEKNGQSLYCIAGVIAGVLNMEALSNNKTFEEVLHSTDGLKPSQYLLELGINIAGNFHDRGKEFCDWYNQKKQKNLSEFIKI